MENNRLAKISQNKWFIPLTLLILWILATIIRFIIALSTSGNPSIMPDEELYLQISNSLANGGQVLFRGQPVRYEYLLYPFILIPLQWLPAGINIFRSIQLLNCLLMNAAVFPAFYLGKQITKNREKGFLIAILAIIAPDLIMVNHIMSDGLMYLLILTFIYVGYKALFNNENKYGILCGLMTFLIFATKPGPAIIGVVFFIAMIIVAAKNKDRKKFTQLACFLITFAILFIVYKLIIHGMLGVDLSQTGVYVEQIKEFSFTNILQTLNGLLVYAIYLPFAFMIIPLVLPLTHIKSFTKENKTLLITVLVSMAAIVVGIVYGIYLDELTADPFATRIHIRYVAAFLPILFAFCLSPEMKKARVKISLLIGSIGIAIGVILLAGKNIYSGRHYPVDSLLLSPLIQDGVLSGRVWVPLIILMFAGIMIARIAQNGFKIKEQRIFLIFISCYMILCNIPGYNLNMHNVDKLLTTEAISAKEIAGDDVLYIAPDLQAQWPAATSLDVQYKGGLKVVEFDDLIGNLVKNNGVLTDFIPKDYWRTKSVNTLSVPNKLILPSELMYRMRLNESVGYEVSQDNTYAIITPTQSGTPLLHSALSGFNQNWVQEGSRFTLYDQTTLSTGKIKFQFQARAGVGNAWLTLSVDGLDPINFYLSDQLGWYETEIAVTDPTSPLVVNFSMYNVNIYIETYLVQPVISGVDPENAEGPNEDNPDGGDPDSEGPNTDNQNTSDPNAEVPNTEVTGACLLYTSCQYK